MMSALRHGLQIGAPLAISATLLACSSDNGQPGDATSAGSNAGGATSGGAGAATGGAGAATAGTSTGGGGGAAAGSGGTAGTGGNGGSGGAGGAMAGGCVVSMTDDEQPMLLSQTGCINMADPTKPAAGLIPYSVRSALWSDGASKERFVRVPDGTKIHVLDCAVETDACKDPGLGGKGEDDGHWDMPVGSVLVKNFSIEGKHIETRLLLHRSTSNISGWIGFSYEWNDAQTDATLLPDNADGKDKPVGSAQQVWHYPSRGQCMDCHTRYAGRSLGPTTAQLNADFAYAEGSMNQLEKFKALGLFEAPPKDIAGYPDPAGTDMLEGRARSYLQTNCAICHRPGGAATTVDLRFSTAFADTKLCEKVEHIENVPAYRLAPGSPLKSTMSVRMHALDMLRMPKFGSKVVDAVGTKLIDDWITAMPTNACPPQP